MTSSYFCGVKISRTRIEKRPSANNNYRQFHLWFSSDGRMRILPPRPSGAVFASSPFWCCFLPMALTCKLAKDSWYSKRDIKPDKHTLSKKILACIIGIQVLHHYCVACYHGNGNGGYYVFVAIHCQDPPMCTSVTCFLRWELKKLMLRENVCSKIWLQS